MIIYDPEVCMLYPGTAVLWKFEHYHIQVIQLIPPYSIVKFEKLSLQKVGNQLLGI